MLERRTVVALPLLALVLGACATIPTGPGISVMPGKGKTLAEFQNDDAICRQYAQGSVSGLTPEEAATTSGAKSAIVGTALGAAAGAAFGGGEGAAIGAGSGLLAGSALGLGMAGASAGETQYRYDNAYAQCMTTQGNSTPPPPRTAALPEPEYGPPPAPYGPPPPPVYYGYVYEPPVYPVYPYGYYWY